jgi:hypothetical protein
MKGKNPADNTIIITLIKQLEIHTSDVTHMHGFLSAPYKRSCNPSTHTHSKQPGAGNEYGTQEISNKTGK